MPSSPNNIEGKMPSGASSQLQPHTSKFWPILAVLRTKRYGGMILGTGLAYAITYMLVVGIISYYPDWETDWNSMNFPVVRSSSLGITIIPYNHIFIFMFYSASAFMVVSSFLVGLNVALMVYSRRMRRLCGIKAKNVGARSMFGLLPAFFTSFACCGGGLLTVVLGATAFGTLSLYSQYMTPISIAALASGTYLASTKIAKECR